MVDILKTEPSAWEVFVGNKVQRRVIPYGRTALIRNYTSGKYIHSSD